MAYPAVTGRRIPYGVNGTEIARGLDFNSGFTTWLDQTAKTALNTNACTYTAGLGKTIDYYFWFPELTEITHIGVQFIENSYELNIRGSVDTTNGLDGTWETAGYTLPTANRDHSDFWRDSIFAVSFSSAIKCLVVSSSNPSGFPGIKGLHLYGQKKAGETVDDIIFCDLS